ncbi:hypothetical protein [Soonwooa sp.]|uniref:hypothetical protein n=1 Tax=Soonwooa sp. TaxID=1938592 RepID=UPI0028ACC704|nr:hypothetical protein [Soonwooa sp.]
MSKTKQPAKASTVRLYTDVRRNYARLSSIMEFGKQKHSDEWIMAKLAFDFYLSEKTVENIIFNRV